MTSETFGIPAALWLWTPVIYLPFVALMRAVLPLETFLVIFEGEFGLTELATAIVLVPAAALAFGQARRLQRARARAAAALLTVFGLGCCFLLLEEISYGQHIFEWRSPEYFQENNLQAETNLHNMAYFDKNVLKWLTLLFALVAGAALPLWFRRFGAPSRLARTALLAPLLPASLVCLPTALIAVIMHLAVKFTHWRWSLEFKNLTQIDVREVTELYIALFFLLYALALRRGHAVANGLPATSPA